MFDDTEVSMSWGFGSLLDRYLYRIYSVDIECIQIKYIEWNILCTIYKNTFNIIYCISAKQHFFTILYMYTYIYIYIIYRYYSYLCTYITCLLSIWIPLFWKIHCNSSSRRLHFRSRRLPHSPWLVPKAFDHLLSRASHKRWLVSQRQIGGL